MPFWFSIVLALCAVAITGALVAAIVAAVGAIRRAERVMAVVERAVDRDLPPLLRGLRELTDELRRLSHGATAELDRIGEITGRVREITDGTARLLGALAGLTRVGTLVGIAGGVKTGVEVFLHRLRRRGDGHE